MNTTRRGWQGRGQVRKTVGVFVALSHADAGTSKITEHYLLVCQEDAKDNGLRNEPMNSMLTEAN